MVNNQTVSILDMIRRMRHAWGTVGCLCCLLCSWEPVCAEEPPRLRRFFANLQLGTAYEYTGANTLLQPLIDARLAVGGEFGVALDRQRRASLLLQGLAQIDPQYPAEANGLILLGFQYHIPLVLAGLYLSPRFSLGYASASVLIPGGDYIASERHSFAVLTPELALTYVFRSGLALMLTPLSFPTLMRSEYATLDYHAFYSAFLGLGFHWGNVASSP